MKEDSFDLAVLVAVVLAVASLPVIILFISFPSIWTGIECAIIAIILLSTSIRVIYRRIRGRMDDKRQIIRSGAGSGELRYQATTLFLFVCFFAITLPSGVILIKLFEWFGNHIEQMASAELILLAIIGYWKRKSLSKLISKIYHSIPGQ